MKSRFTKRDRFVTGTILAGASVVGLAVPAAAQEAETSSVEEIVITGSRVSSNLTSASPLTTIGQDEIQFQGATRVEDLLNRLPAVLAEFDQGVGNGATGTATTSLRGLTSKRTLVLVNGNRLMPGDPFFPSPDLNNIPATLVERVEVVTGGASAVYGSDAVAGVVNFIMQDDFEGVRIDAQTTAAYHKNDNAYMQGLIEDFNASTVPGNEIEIPEDGWDAETYDVSIAAGVNSEDGKGNITAYAGYRNIEPLTQARRDYGVCSLTTGYSADPNVYDIQYCAGSSNSAFGRFRPSGGAPGFANNPDGSQTFVPFSGGAFAFNFAPFNFYQQNDERYTAGYFANYEANDFLNLYSHLMFMDDTQINDIAPSGLFQGPDYFISCDNPLMSAAQQAVICGPGATLAPDPANPDRVLATNMLIGYRFADIPRTTRNEHTAYTINVGADGPVAGAWRYDFRLQYGHTSFRSLATGDLSISRIQQALNATAAGEGGGAVCADPAAVAAGCVPLNIFTARSAGITQEQLDWVSARSLSMGHTTEQSALLVFTGDLSDLGGKSPWADDPIRLAFGAEYRNEELEVITDELASSGDLSGTGGATPPASGHYDVVEFFAEAGLPIAQERPPFHYLGLEAGFRYSDYSLAGAVESYKLSGGWAPTKDIRFRGGYNRAVRAPNIVELFTPQNIGLFGGQDPCAGPAATTPAGCVNTFATPEAYAALIGTIDNCASAQCTALFGSPVDAAALAPEEADTYTVGMVFTPSFLPNFDLTLDWYDIEITAPLQGGNVNVVLAECINNNRFCDRIHRDPINGSLNGVSLNDGFVALITENQGALKTAGIDVSASYRIDLADAGMGGPGGLSFNFTGTRVDTYEIAAADEVVPYDCVGLFGPICGSNVTVPLAEWRHSFRTTWQTPWPVALSFNWRHIGEVELDLNQGSPIPTARDPSFVDTPDGHIDAFDYFDLSGTWDMTSNVTWRFGVNNLADTDPPVFDTNNLGVTAPPYGNGNTFPGLYDSLGRTFFLGATADF